MFWVGLGIVLAGWLIKCGLENFGTELKEGLKALAELED